MSEEVSLKKINGLISERVELHEAKKKLEEEVADHNGRISKLDKHITTILESADLVGYLHPETSVTRKTRMHVKNPQTPEDKELLFKFLRENNLLDEYQTINNKSLNSLFKKLKEAKEMAIEARGEVDKEALLEAVEFSIPGIERPSISSYLTFKKS